MKAKDLKQVKQSLKSTPFILHEVQLMYHKREIPSMTKIKCSYDAYQISLSCYDEKTIGIKESFFLLCLDRSNNVRCIAKISEGGISGTVTDIRLIYATAILSLASGIIVVHNHPSGNIQPSESDTKITQKIKEAGNIMDIQLMDHLIINGLLTETDKYYSFADSGII